MKLLQVKANYGAISTRLPGLYDVFYQSTNTVNKRLKIAVNIILHVDLSEFQRCGGGEFQVQRILCIILEV